VNVFVLVRALSHPLRSVVAVTLALGRPQEEAWIEGERRTVALMGTINMAVAELVSAIRVLDDVDGWMGHGIRSIEHWVQWKACVSERRA
jgi:hypothetical protein